MFYVVILLSITYQQGNDEVIACYLKLGGVKEVAADTYMNPLYIHDRPVVKKSSNVLTLKTV